MNCSPTEKTFCLIYNLDTVHTFLRGCGCGCTFARGSAHPSEARPLHSRLDEPRRRSEVTADWALEGVDWALLSVEWVLENVEWALLSVERA